MKQKVALLLIITLFGVVAVGCGPRLTLVRNLGNAENSLFTEDGRLFITGADLWEIKQENRGYKAVTLSDNLDCQYTGMAQYNNHLFAVCYRDSQGAAWLVRAELTDTPRFEKVFQLTGMTLANGMALDGDGHLYIADSTMPKSTGKIIRVSLTDEPVPQVVESSQMVWLKAENGAQSPNGMTIADNKLFFSNIDTSTPGQIVTNIKRVAIDGDRHGLVQAVFQRAALRNSSMFDDLTSINLQGTTYLIGADYLKGSVFTLDASKIDQTQPLYETDPDKFAGPTSCIIGQGLGFNMQELLVTEGGIVTIDPNSNFGNRLSLVRYQPQN